MKILACDIGSTHLKIQPFVFNRQKKTACSVGGMHVVHHGQNWLLDREPVQALSEWLSLALAHITPNRLKHYDAIGFSTYREAIIGLSSTERVVFAGTNLQPHPVGEIQEVQTLTTLAGWFAWKLAGECRATDGQQTAGDIYIKRIALQSPRWCGLCKAGKDIKPKHVSGPAIYLGGTDEQLGYLGAGMDLPHGPDLVIATGTFWSVSSMASGAVKSGVRRTECSSSFPAVDSCVFYKWGPMVHALSGGSLICAEHERVEDRYFGQATSLWLSNSPSADMIRKAMINDLRVACATLSTCERPRILVHGGGSRMEYVRNILDEALAGSVVEYLDTDATTLGCAIAGGCQL